MTGAKVLTLQQAARDNRRRELDEEVWDLFAWAKRVQRLTVEQCAERCRCSPDAIKLYLRRRRRVPGSVLRAMNLTVALPERERKAA